MTCSYSKEFSRSSFTDVENAFIYEYLPSSPGEAVKVYLYGLFLCQNPEHDQELEKIAQNLKMSTHDVVDCFKYWEEFGILSVVSENPFTVQYLPVRGATSTKPRKYKAEKYTEFTKGLQALLPARMISTGEYTEYFNIMETFGIKPEAMLMIVKYCADRKGPDIGYHYVSKVAKDFGNRGIVTLEAVEKELSSYVLRTSVLEKIFKALSIRRQPEIEDSNLLKKWTRELGFDEENVIFAASKLKKSTMQKLDEFILELYSIKSFSKEEISSYLDQKAEVYDLAIKINKALSVYVDVLDTVIDTYTKKWLSFGFDAQTLLYVASHCFKVGKNTLRDMDELIENLRNRGFVDLSSVGDFFDQEKKTEEFISKLLLSAGINRRPNEWDKQNLSVWKSWNFTDEMILEAAKLSSGKNSPLAYVNVVLSNWKNNGVFSTESIQTSSAPNSQEEYNREYEKRRKLAHSTAQKNMDSAMALEGFSELYGRLNSMEKDLAFAEISGDSNALKALEQEQENIKERITSLLETINLTISDLSPKFRCDKCNDTGYVGTHKCDCY